MWSSVYVCAGRGGASAAGRAEEVRGGSLETQVAGGLGLWLYGHIRIWAWVQDSFSLILTPMCFRPSQRSLLLRACHPLSPTLTPGFRVLGSHICELLSHSHSLSPNLLCVCLLKVATCVADFFAGLPAHSLGPTPDNMVCAGRPHSLTLFHSPAHASCFLSLFLMQGGGRAAGCLRFLTHLQLRATAGVPASAARCGCGAGII